MADKPTRVLIIDDDEILLQACQEYLTRTTDFGLHTASSYTQAKELLERYRYDVAIVDVFLEEGRDLGLDLLATIKGRCPNVQVIMITGYSDRSSERQLMRLRAFDFLQKPFKPEDLIEPIKKAAEWKTNLDERDLLLKEQIYLKSPEIKELMQKFNVLINDNQRRLDLVNEKISKTINYLRKHDIKTGGK